METTIMVKGRVVIPAEMQKKLNIEEGTRISLELDEENQQIILTPITREYIHSLRGKYKGRGMLKALMEDRQRERDL